MCITPEALTEFARSSLHFSLPQDEAERLSRLYTAMIRSALATEMAATRKMHLTSQPLPFKIRNWRELSGFRRRLFGHVVKKGGKTGRASGVETLPDGNYGIAHRRQGRPGHMAIIMQPALWFAPTTTPGTGEIGQVYKRWQESPEADRKVIISGHRLYDAIPKTRQKQQQNRYEIRNDPEFPFRTIPRGEETTAGIVLTGEELAYLATLFGMHSGDHADYFRSKGVTVCFNDGKKPFVSFALTPPSVTVVFTT